MPKRKSNKSYSKKSYSSNQIARIAREAVQKVQEKKVCPISVGPQSIGTTGATYDLAITTQGDKSDQRTGNEINATGLYITGQVEKGDTYNQFRFILYDPIDSDESLTNITTLQKIDQTQFRVLKDFVFTLDTSTPVRNFTIKKSWKKSKYNALPIKYKSNSDTTSFNHRLKLYVVSDSTVTPDVKITLASYLYYTDS